MHRAIAPQNSHPSFPFLTCSKRYNLRKLLLQLVEQVSKTNNITKTAVVRRPRKMINIVIICSPIMQQHIQCFTFHIKSVNEQHEQFKRSKIGTRSMGIFFSFAMTQPDAQAIPDVVTDMLPKKCCILINYGSKHYENVGLYMQATNYSQSLILGQLRLSHTSSLICHTDGPKLG